MKTISLIFKVHQPFRLRKYRFFDIGSTHNYYDDYQNKYALKRFAEMSYTPANALMGKMLDTYSKDFSFAFAFSGTLIDQMCWYAPELLEEFKKLGANKNVEFLAKPYSSSLVSLLSKDCFCDQVKAHCKRIKEVFGKTPEVLANTDLIYSDEIGKWASQMKFKGVIMEGAKHILGWKSPHFVYEHPETGLPLLLRDGGLSENISLRFSDQQWEQWPYTVDKLIQSIVSEEGDTHVNLFINYAVMGELQKENSGIFAFMEALIQCVAENKNLAFVMPSDLCKMQTVGALRVPVPVSCVDEERDLTACYGNELQKDVVENWEKVLPFIQASSNQEILKDFTYLISADHLHYMSTKMFSTQPSPLYIRPYDSPYDAYINYMNVFSDLMQRVGVYDQERNVMENKKINRSTYGSSNNKETMKETSVINKNAKKMKTETKTTKPAAKKPAAKKPAVKKATPKAAAKPAVKKATPKAAAKPAVKKATPKAAAKPAVKKAAPKAAAKPAVKKAAPKAAAKPAVKKAAPKAAAKPAVKKAAPKAAKTTAKKTVAPKAKVTKKTTAVKKAAPKASKPAVKKATPKSPKVVAKKTTKSAPKTAAKKTVKTKK